MEKRGIRYDLLKHLCLQGVSTLNALGGTDVDIDILLWFTFQFSFYYFRLVWDAKVFHKNIQSTRELLLINQSINQQ